MIDTRLLLTIVLESPEEVARESVLYRRLLAARLKFEHLFEIAIVNEPINISNLNKLCREMSSKYVVFLRDSHEVSANYLPTLLRYLENRTVYLAEPIMYKGAIPEKITDSTVNNKYYYTRDTDIYGIAYNTRRLIDVLDAVGDIDRTGFYISYRMYWSINVVQRLRTGFSTASDHQAVNGIQVDSQTNRLFPLILGQSIELRLGILRYIALLLRGARVTKKVPVSLDHIRELISVFELQKLIQYVATAQPFETVWISWFVQPGNNSQLYKQMTNHDLYLDFFDESIMCNSEVPLYELTFGNELLRIGKSYKKCAERPGFDDPANYDFYSRRIETESTIIFFDRPMSADDNAEHLYEYIRINHPEFTKVYFALNPKSSDWERLERKGFKLIRMFSPDFYKKYLESDLVVSSQIYNLNYLGKTLANSRFVYLQHGIQLNDMTDWVLSKNFDVFIATGKYEADYLGKLAPLETLNSGLPRLESLMRTNSPDKILVFMPTWRFNLHQSSSEQFKKSSYFRAIDSLIQDSELLEFLTRTNRVLYIKLHPNVSHRAELFHFSERVVNSTMSYRKSFELAEGVFTDFSSAVLDAAFIETPIAYYQWDASEFFSDQAYESRLDYETDGLGPVFRNHSEFVDHIIKEKYLERNDQFNYRRLQFFDGVDPKRINARIMERILEL